MKKYVLLILLSFSVCLMGYSQEWLTSLEAAKRIAWVQNKFLFMVWEDATEIPYPITMNNDRGLTVLFDNLFGNEEIDQIIWNYFVPVKVSESEYAKLYDQIKDTKSKTYIAQFEDDNIKIMDANGVILNTSDSPEAYFNLSKFISKYALHTSFLSGELKSYSEHPNFNSAFRLGSKYMDFAILVNASVRKDVLNMADMYLDEADHFLSEEASTDSSNFQTKINLLRLSKYLIQDRPRKVLRKLKRINETEIDPGNASQYEFLHYTAYLLRRDMKNAQLWQNKVSEVNLKKARLIANLHR